MVHEGRRMVATEGEFTLVIADHAVEPEEIFEDLADALIDLEDAAEQLLDSTVSLDAGVPAITITLTTTGETFDAAAKAADSAVRSCIRAAGRVTPGWTAATVRRASALVSA